MCSNLSPSINSSSCQTPSFQLRQFEKKAYQMDANSLAKNDANFAELTPLTFIYRAALAYADHTSVVYENTQFTWKQTYERCIRLAAWLQSVGIKKNDVVSILAPNVPALYESHFGVPMAGAVLNTINTRLSAEAIAGILRHSGAKILFADHQLLSLARDALSFLTSRPVLVVIGDISSTSCHVPLPHGLEYERVLASADPVAYPPVPVTNEWDAIALNYTSGTTSDPKGVVYSHRGAYLSTLTLLLQWGVGLQPVYLWSLPMFHCNGWTFTWGMAARGGTNVCIRSPTARDMYQAISSHGVTHMCGAPVLFNVLLEASPTDRRQLTRPVKMLTGGAPPPAALLERIEHLGFCITHAYGLTEATGPALICEWQEAWNRFPAADRARLKARQGVGVLSLADTDVKDETMQSVPRDGITQGQICLRGSNIMKGYFKNEKATDEAMKNGWFLTGDVGVMHPDGYIEIKDRLKDVIISGGENISSVDVETALYRHPMVLEAAVVAMLHPHWGETPCAFIVLKKEYASNEAGIEEEDIISYCRDKLSHYMVPRKVVFVEELPKTATGKIQKFVLREVAKKLNVSDRKKEPQGGAAGSPCQVGPQSNDIKRQPEAEAHVLALSRL